MKYRVIELISTLGDGGAEALVKDYAIMLNKLNVQTDILTKLYTEKKQEIFLI